MTFEPNSHLGDLAEEKIQAGGRCQVLLNLVT